MKCGGTVCTNDIYTVTMYNQQNQDDVHSELGSQCMKYSALLDFLQTYFSSQFSNWNCLPHPDKSWLLFTIFHVLKYQHSVVVVTLGKLCVTLGHAGSENVIKQSEPKYWYESINFLMLLMPQPRGKPMKMSISIKSDMYVTYNYLAKEEWIQARSLELCWI